MTYKRILINILPAVVLVSLLFGKETLADGNYALLESVGTLAEGSRPAFKDYMTEILRVGIAIAGLLAVVELVVGGIQYVLSSASEKQAAAAKDRIENALVGLIIGIAAVLILNVINPDILAGNLSIPDIPSSTVSPTP